MTQVETGGGVQIQSGSTILAYITGVTSTSKVTVADAGASVFSGLETIG